jgi:hypothetical protein
MEICHNCLYHCNHQNNPPDKKRNVCWICFTVNHLLATVFKIDNMNFFICNDDIRIKMIDHPGYFLCYNYQNKIYKLVKIQDLVKTNYYLIKHIVARYICLNKNKSFSEKVNKMTITDYGVLDEIFKEKYALNLYPLEIFKV